MSGPWHNLLCNWTDSMSAFAKQTVRLTVPANLSQMPSSIPAASVMLKCVVLISQQKTSSFGWTCYAAFAIDVLFLFENKRSHFMTFVLS